MGVVFTDDFSDDLGRFPGLCRGDQSEVPKHRKENSSLHRFEAIAHVRKRARRNHGEGVAQITVFRGGLEICLVC